MRTPRPYFREFDCWWYVQVRTDDGKRRQVKLAQGRDNRAEAYSRFCELMAQQDPAHAANRARLNVASLFDTFLDWAEQHTARCTFDQYKHFLQSFSDLQGQLLVAELKPFHVTRWLDSHKWADSTRRSAIIAVKRAVQWAQEQGYIDALPLRTLKRPPATRRTKLITADEHKRMQEASDPHFRDFLTALKETGARPGEVAAVTAQDVDLDRGIWILRQHKTAKKSGRPRIIYLTPVMIDLTTRAREQHPEGPLFRNSDGQPWNRNAIRLRMRRLRKKLDLPPGTVAYAYRHSFATNGLAAGVPIATMAELLGHADTSMISAHYAHLNQCTDHLRAAASSAAAAGGA